MPPYQFQPWSIDCNTTVRTAIVKQIIILWGTTWKTRQIVVSHGISVVFSPIIIQLFLYDGHVYVNQGDLIITIIKIPKSFWFKLAKDFLPTYEPLTHKLWPEPFDLLIVYWTTIFPAFIHVLELCWWKVLWAVNASTISVPWSDRIFEGIMTIY